MSFLRLGVACAVFDDQGHVLLSKRGDFDTWNLPTGRLDRGEYLSAAAAREAHEETGIICQIDRLVGLYYHAGRGRMNVLFTGTMTGGHLLQDTPESTENRFFAPDHLPDDIFGDFMVRDALAGGVHLFTLHTPPDVLRDLRFKLARRWLSNLLQGRPEPRYPRFDVSARYGEQSVYCDGQASPWAQIGQAAGVDSERLCLSDVDETPETGRIAFTFTDRDGACLAVKAVL